MISKDVGNTASSPSLSVGASALVVRKLGAACAAEAGMAVAAPRLRQQGPMRQRVVGATRAVEAAVTVPGEAACASNWHSACRKRLYTFCRAPENVFPATVAAFIQVETDENQRQTVVDRVTTNLEFPSPRSAEPCSIRRMASIGVPSIHPDATLSPPCNSCTLSLASEPYVLASGRL